MKNKTMNELGEAGPVAINDPFDPRLYRNEAISPESRAILERGGSTPIPEFKDTGHLINDVRRYGDLMDGIYSEKRSENAVTRMIKGPAGELPIRIFMPDNQPRAVFYHILGGGWFMGSAAMMDQSLTELSRDLQLAVVSVDYRLAPEFPYPAAPDDCEAAALWLAENARTEFGTDSLFIGGESAGAHLAAVTLVRMAEKHGFRGFKGALLKSGAYDLNGVPSEVLMSGVDIRGIREWFAPGGDFRDPDLSPIFADLRGMPPVLFAVGTQDALLDHSLYMYVRWISSGNDAQLAVYPGALHGMSGPEKQQYREFSARFLSELISA